MNSKIISAIEKAICNKYFLIAYGLGISEGAKNCPLCNLFIEDDCNGCPIYELDHDKYYKCNNTPCRRIKTYTILSAKNPEMIDAVEKEIDFLSSLLPKDHKYFYKRGSNE